MEEINWGPAHANKDGVTTKQAECGCEVMLAGDFIVRACSTKHFDIIYDKTQEWNAIKKIHNGIAEAEK